MARDVGDWTREKLKLLELYLPGYLNATTRAQDRIYIDGFAGPGKNQLRSAPREIIDGSPLIALNAVGKNAEVRFSELYFIESEPEAAAVLRREIEERGDRRATVITGDVNIELPRIVQGLNKRAPTFVFLDTEGIEPCWDTIEAIAPWKTELLINFPLGTAINRNPDSPKVTKYFGTPDWRYLWDRRDTRGLLDLYKARLTNIGYVEQVEHDRLVAREPGGGGQHYYYLVPVSKHKAAIRIWNWVLKQPEASGQTRLGLGS